MPVSLNSLTNNQKNLCEYCGGFGALLSLVCLIQHIIFAIPSWFTYPMIPAYLFTIIAFILLALQKPVSFILLILSAVFVSVIEYIFISHYAFSLIVLLLFIYTVIIIVVLIAEQIPKKLKQHQELKKSEEDFWKEKI